LALIFFMFTDMTEQDHPCLLLYDFETMRKARRLE
jgi:hypothetical protein